MKTRVSGAALTIALCVAGHVLGSGAPVSRASTLYYWGVIPFGPTLLTNTPSTLSNAIAVAIGDRHVVALTTSGKIVAWGDNSEGQCNVPVDLTNVVAVTAGSLFTAALTQNGRVTILGHHGAPFPPETDPMPAELNNIVALASGQSLSIALKADTTVIAWGTSNLGLTNFTQYGLSNIVSVGAGDRHVLAVRDDGTVVSWLYGWQPVPEHVTNVVAATGGFNHSLALRADGTVVAWGSDYSHGQLDVPPQATNIVAIAARTYASAALRADGTVIAWGENGPDQYAFTNPPVLPFVTSMAVGPYGAVALADTNTAAPPVIVVQPASQTAPYGSDAILSVFATGWGSLSYQWYLNETNLLAGATNRFLRLTNLQLSQTGAYTVRVRNLGGTVLSAPAFLNVVPGMHIHMVPRVRIEGDIGRTYRLDYVNAVGDPGAWVTITNITLTAAPFYYLDESAVGQPRRFYRVVPSP